MAGYRPTVATLAIAAGCLLVGSVGGAVAGPLITGADIKDGTVTTRDIHDGTLRLNDMSKDVKETYQRIGAFQEITKDSADVDEGDEVYVAASCPFGTKAISGAAFWNGSLTAPQSYPSVGSDTTWVANGVNQGGTTDHITLTVFCGKVAYAPSN